ncbi:MAG: CapA family protein [Hungatella sp.]|uniref:CapA family protein n=1 Tax=Hungatella sp. TaxID=2613924 RepID=UPI003993EF37
MLLSHAFISGGQFNEEPGEYSKFIVDFFVKKGVDIIVGNHPHVIQKAYNIDSAVVAYSLGGI